MLQNKCLVFSCKISVWGGEKTDRVISNAVCLQNSAPARSGKFTKLLLGQSCAELDAIKGAAQSIRSWIAENTLPYDRGMVLIPVEKLMGFLSKLKQHQECFYTLVENFVVAYPDLINKAKESGNTLFSESDCPSKDDISSRFAFTFHLEPLPDENKFSEVAGVKEIEEHIKTELASRMRQIQSQAEMNLLDRLKERKEALIQTFAEKAGNRKVLAKTLESIQLVNQLNVMSSSSVTAMSSMLQGVCDKWELLKDPNERQRTLDMLKQWA